MAKKLPGPNLNFLAITFEPVVRLIPNFEVVKICRVDGLFAKAIITLGQWPGTLFTVGVERLVMPLFKN